MTSEKMEKIMSRKDRVTTKTRAMNTARSTKANRSSTSFQCRRSTVGVSSSNIESGQWHVFCDTVMYVSIGFRGVLGDVDVG